MATAMQGKVKLKEGDRGYVSGLLRDAHALMTSGRFELLDGLGLSRQFYREEILKISQRYQEKTSHDHYIAELRRAGGFTWFETASFILDAAEKLNAETGEDCVVKARNSIVVARKIADENLEGEEKLGIISRAEGAGRRPPQHNYPDTHYVNSDGVRKRKLDD